MSRLGAAPIGVYSDDGLRLAGLEHPNGNQAVVTTLYNSVAGLQADQVAGRLDVGDYKVGNRKFTYDGLALVEIGPRFSKRPKIATFGNSINGQETLSSNGFFSWCHVDWILNLFGRPFDRCRSVPGSQIAAGLGANPNAGGNDELGNWAYGGATCGPTNGVYAGSTMLLGIVPFLRTLIDKPDIIYLNSLFENDLSTNATPNLIQIQYAAIMYVQACQSIFPDAIVIVSSPSPSSTYALPAQQSAFLSLTNWVLYGLPGFFKNVYAEDNRAGLLAGSTWSADPGLINGGPHPNTYGAIKRARSFWAQFSWMFPNALAVPYINGSYPGSFVANPDFTGAAFATINTTTNTAYLGGQYYGRGDIYTGGNLQAQLSPLSSNPPGINLKLAALTAPPPSPTAAISTEYGFTLTSSNSGSNISSNTVYVAVAVIQIVNPINLSDIAIALIQNDSTFYFSTMMQTADLQQNPLGLSSQLVAGDVLTLMTAPILPISTLTGTHLNAQLKIYGTTGLPVGFGGNNPSINILVLNIIAVDNNKPVQLPVATGAYKYTNQSKGLQQVIIAGGTVSSITISLDGGITQYGATSPVILRPGDAVTINNTVVPNEALLVQLS